MSLPIGFRAVALVLVLLLAVQLNVYLERVTPELAPWHSFYLPSGPYLRMASLGFALPLADLLYIWSIQYYSVERQDRWRHLARLYDVITDLDPRFVTAYSIGAIILALEAGQPREALRLLDKGVENNPQTYSLAFEAGFYARELGDQQLARRYFAIAKDRPDAPEFVARWYYYTVAKTGQKAEALALWREALATARSDYERRVAERHVDRLERELLLDELRQAVQAFRERNQRPPFALEELVRAGLLTPSRLREAEERVDYDRASGQVLPADASLRQRLR